MTIEEEDRLIERLQAADGTLSMSERRLAAALRDDRKRNQERIDRKSADLNRIEDVRAPLRDRLSYSDCRSADEQVSAVQPLLLSSDCIEKLDRLASEFECSREAMVEHLVDAIIQQPQWKHRSETA